MSFIIRIDDRLIHGQVVEGWIKPLQISLIVICSDTVYCDVMQKTLFELSIPPRVKLQCNSIQTTAENIVNKKYDNEHTLILISSLNDLNVLVENVKKLSPEYIFEPVNIGGLRHSGNKKQIYRAMCLDINDLLLIKKFIDLGIIMEYYLLPNDTKIVINSVISNIEKIVNTGEAQNE